MGLAAVRHRGEQGGILSIEDLDEAIGLVGLCDIEKAMVKTQLDAQVAQLKADAVAKAIEIAERRQQWLAMIETFMEAKKGELLGTRKSLTLNYGKVGYRKATDTIELPKKGTEEMEDLVDLIKVLRIREDDAFSDVPIHEQRWVTKGDMKELDNEQLSALGIPYTEGGDKFFCQPDRQRIKTGKELQNG